MNKSYLPVLLVLLSVFFSCTGNNSKDVAASVNGDGNGTTNSTINSRPANVVPEEFSPFGQWILGRLALYNEGGEEILDTVPPDATSPIVQNHYVEISEDGGVKHLIIATPLEDGTAYNVFLGDERSFSWSEDSGTVVTDFYSGENLQFCIYKVEEGRFLLRPVEFNKTNGTDYEPILAFSSLRVEEWNDANDRAMIKGTPVYESKLQEYIDFFRDVMKYDTPFVLNQFFVR